MDKKRKISIRKVLQVLVTLIVTTGCVIAISSASNKEIVRQVSGVKVTIKNAQYHFIDKEEIKNMLFTNRHINIVGTPVNKVDIHSMEKIIASNPWVASTQVYIDNKRVLHVNVVQRVPVARIFEETGNSYYIDSTMSMMPISGKYVYYTTVVTGVPTLKNDSAGKSLMAQIAGLVRHIEHDTFWNAQVSQIIMLPDHSFELVPVLGGQRILFGDTTRMEEKLDNLFVFYKNIMNKIGWDKYEVLDLRYKDQVVASPSIPWKGPADKMMSDMSWVNSIMTMAAKDKPAVTFDAMQASNVTSAVATLQPTALTASTSKIESPIAKPQPIEKPAIGPVEDKHPVKSVDKPVAKPAKPEPKSVHTAKQIVGPPEEKTTAKISRTKVAKPQVQAKSTKVKLPEQKIATKKEDNKDTRAAKPEKENEEKQERTPKYIYGNNNH